MNLDPLPPAEPGTYVLLLRVDHAQTLVVGRLGELAVIPGWYCYAGSALGPGGLRGRLRHHLAPVVRPHWHIDYLRRAATVEEVHWLASPQRLEHAWAAMLASLPGATVPFRRFGASDCRCPAHLVHFAARPTLPLP